jgi:TRAP-type uncharacterized transport system substrate-binding protein
VWGQVEHLLEGLRRLDVLVILGAISVFIETVGWPRLAFAFVLIIIWFSLLPHVFGSTKSRGRAAFASVLLAIFFAAAFDGISPFLPSPTDRPQGPTPPIPPSPGPVPIPTQQCALPSNDVISAARNLAMEKGPFKMLSGPENGYYHQQAEKMRFKAAEWLVSIDVENTDGSRYNQDRLLDRLIFDRSGHLIRDKNPGTWAAFTQSDIQENYPFKDDLQVLRPHVFREQMHLLVPRESNIKAFSDLNSKNIGVVGNGTELAVRRALTSANLDGWRVVQITSDEAQLALSKRERGPFVVEWWRPALDAIFYIVHAPAALFYTPTKPIRLVPINIELFQNDRLLRRNYFHADFEYQQYPAWMNANIPTIEVWTQLVARKNSACAAMTFFNKLSEDVGF